MQGLKREARRISPEFQLLYGEVMKEIGADSMCFSAELSLAAGAILLPLGAYASTAAWIKNRAYVPLAVIPLLLAVQHIGEAGVWAGLTRGVPDLVKPASLTLLFFALGFWPFWIPYCAAALEERPRQRLPLIFAAEAGLLVGCVAFLPAAARFDDWVAVGIVNHSLRYDFSAIPWAGPIPGGVWGMIYLALVCGPLLLSRERPLRLLGLGCVVSAGVSAFFFWCALASVWCFFAVLLSLHIAYILYQLPASEKPAGLVRGQVPS